ncbi:MAG: hypothetical protein ACYDBH_00430 [Acidobacteriaceae bacterium]
MTIADLMSDKDPLIRLLATKAANYRQQYANGALTLGEYNELCTELLDLKRLAADADMVDLKVAVLEAVEFLAQFVKV